MDLSENRHFTEDYISSQTYQYLKPVLVDKIHHYNENKGDYCANRHPSENIDRDKVINEQSTDENIIHHNYIKCMYTNIDGIISKLEKVKLQIMTKRPDIFAIVDTSLQPNELSDKYCPDDALKVDGYEIFRKDNPSEKKGGLLVYVKETIVTEEDKQINLMCADFKESKWIRLVFGSEVILFGVVYRKGCSTALNDSLFRQTLDKVSNKYSNIIICGDFNYPKINWETCVVDSGPYSKEMRFYDCLMDNFLMQHQTTFTRFRGKDKPSCIDLVITEDSQDEVKSSLVVEPPIGKSDHCILEWKYLISTSTRVCEDKDTTQCTRKNYNKGNYEEISKILMAQDWDTLFEDKSVDEKVAILQSIVDGAIEEYIPNKKPGSKDPKPPWFSKKARKQLRKKRCAWQRYCQSKTYKRYIQYTKERNKAAAAVKNAKKEYEKLIAKECKKNPKLLFQYANFKNKSKRNIIRLKDENGNIMTKDSDNANALNQFFSSVFTTEDDSPELILNKSANLLWNDDINDPFSEQDDKPPPNQLSDIIIEESDIIKLLDDIDPFKSTSPECIHPRVLKNCSVSLAPALKNIYNHSMNTGNVPQAWRNGTVSPLYKGEGRHQPCNYRPITLTSLLCRILERIVKKHVLNHLISNELLSSEQHGFMPKRSCMTNLLSTINEITEMYDRGDPIDEIFLDFQKAFDKVPHQRLLYKVEKMGITGKVLNWIEGFLSARKQRVSLNGTYSTWKPVLSGVPQGSVMGPILFLVYINDLQDGIISKLKLFADDAKIFNPVNSIKDSEIIQNDLDKLCEWCEKWKMNFNKKKCHALQIGRKNMSYIYHLNGFILSPTDEEKDLGVIVSKDLKAHKNIQSSISKANKMVGMIKRTFQYLDKDIFLKLYKTYVRPHVEYCQQICYPYLKQDCEALEKVQKRATKLLHYIKDRSYEERLAELKLYSLDQRRMRGDMIFTFKLLKGFVDVDVSNIFTLHTGSTRGHNLKLKSKTCKSEIRRQFFTNRIVTPWNNLPSNIIESTTLEQFKRSYDKVYGYK